MRIVFINSLSIDPFDGLEEDGKRELEQKARA